MSYIYKITNKINNKIYIGYTSRNIERRFYEHKWEALHSTGRENQSYLYQAIRKYGVENFFIEILLEFDETENDWKKLEKDYIKKYNSIRPNGYNILEGGDQPPIHFGNDNIKTKIKDEELPKLFKMLKDSSLSYEYIANYFNVSISQLYSINSGKSRKQQDVDYPIRKFSLNEEYALQVIELLKTDVTLSNRKIAALIPNYFRANEIASINNGEKYSYLYDGDFPIRKVKVPEDYEEKQKIAKEIISYLKRKNYAVSKKQIQQDLNLSRYIVDKTLKGIYPYNLSDIKSYPIELNK